MKERSGAYRISCTLATGGTAVLYKAIQTSLDRPVAVKRLHAHLVSDPTFMRRFELEAKAAASLDHEHVVRVIDFGRDADGFFIVMEYIDGPSLNDILAERRVLDEETTLLLAREICRGLAHAHERGVVHRDIKPANVMITRAGVVKITDFGLVKLSQSAAQQTVATTLVGTPLYMSPEQATGETVDGRSDLFSLGTICYEALTGAQPFHGDTYAAVIHKIMDGAVEPVSRRRRGIRPETEAIVMKALARDPARRFRGAAEMARAIDSLLGQEAVLGVRERMKALANASDPPAPPPPRRAPRRRRGKRFAPAAAAVAGTAAIAVFALNGALRDGFTGGIEAIRRSDPVQADAGMIPDAAIDIFAGLPESPRENAVPPDTSLASPPPPPASSANPDSTVEDGAPRDTTLSIPNPIPRPEPPETNPPSVAVESPPPTAPSRPAAPPTGYLDVAVTPPASILVDGEPQTATGRIEMLELPAGPHTIVCKREGFHDYVERLSIQKGEASRRRIELREIQGSLVVAGADGARIYVDGTLRGTLSGSESIELPPGPHTVEIRKPGFTAWRNVVHVPADKPLRLSVTLVPSS